MPQLEQIAIAPGLTFDVLAVGETGAPLVLLLHGFAESMHCWDAQVAALANKGYCALAPSQRGYSPGARPDPAKLENYAYEKMIADAIEIATASGYAGKRFHLVGHDWGGQVSWGVAGTHPERLASLTILSRPHPQSFRRALQMPDGEQKHRSRHHRKFLEPETGPMLLEDEARRLRRNLSSQGVPDAAVEAHLGVLGNPAALEGALAWYRANVGLVAELGEITVPTLYIWGDADATVGPTAAHGTRDFVKAAYAMEVLPGVGHFVMDQAPAKTTELLLAHLKRHPV